MQITLTYDDVEETISHGSVLWAVGTDEEGERIAFAADTNVIGPALDALANGQVEEIAFEVEDWQILNATAPLG